MLITFIIYMLLIAVVIAAAAMGVILGFVAIADLIVRLFR